MAHRLFDPKTALIVPALLAIMAAWSPAWAQEERLAAGQYPELSDSMLGAKAARPDYDPFFNTDWSLALRGSYSKDKDDERYEVLASPELSLSHKGSRATLTLDAGADLSQPVNGQINISGLRLGLSGDYAFDRDTKLTGGLALEAISPQAGAVGQVSTVEQGAPSISGRANGGITRQFGRFNMGLNGAINRVVYGQTRLTSGVWQDNSDQNRWSLNGDLRLGYQVTPIFEVFGQAGLGRTMFDAISPTQLVKADASSASVQAGVMGRWGDRLEVQVATGIEWRRFDASSLGEVRSNLYDASISYLLDPTLRLTAGLSTEVSPSGPDSNGVVRTQYEARAGVDYTINSWLAVNGLASWRAARFTGSNATETGYGLGAGAQYLLNQHTTVSADYGFEHANTSSDGINDSHRVSVGVTLKR